MTGASSSSGNTRVVLASALSVACPGADVADGESVSVASIPCDERPIALRIEPAFAQLDAGPARDADVRFRAIALFADGRSAEVPAAWASTLGLAGAIHASGLYVASGDSGGEGTLTAVARGAEAQARLGVTWVERVPANVGPDVLARFSDDLRRVADHGTLRIVEPEEGARLSSDPAGVLLRWSGAGHSGFRLRLLSATTDVSIYTSSERFEPDAGVWRRAIESNRGGTLRVVLEASDGDGVVHRSTGEFHVRPCAADEICNGMDDDCDDQVDDLCTPRDDRTVPPSDCPETAE